MGIQPDWCMETHLEYMQSHTSCNNIIQVVVLVVFCLRHVEAVTQRRDCKQLQNHTHISTRRRMELTPFNAHRRSLSSVAVTAGHGLHLQHYTATNLRNRVFMCRHRSRALAICPCHVPFMPVLAHHAWATRLVRYHDSDLRNKSYWELTRSVSQLSL